MSISSQDPTFGHMQYKHRGPPILEPGFQPEPTPGTPSHDRFNNDYQHGGGLRSSSNSPTPHKQSPAFSVVNPGFNLIKPIDWAKLRNRNTFEPLNKFQLQTLTKGKRKTYHNYLMDWQKWKNSINPMSGENGGYPNKDTNFNYSRMMDPE